MMHKPVEFELSEQEFKDRYDLPEQPERRKHRRWDRPAARPAHRKKQMGFMLSPGHDELIEEWAQRNRITRSDALAMMIERAVKTTRY